jgi:3-oxoacyl-[acyl-carrier-protein] synthase-3
VARGAISAVPLWGERVRREVLEDHGYKPSDVALMATNAAFVWYSPVLSKVLDIPMARVEDNVLQFSNMGSVNLPMNLYLARQKKRIKDGDLVLLVGHGGGLSYGGILMRWHDA